MPRTYTEKFSEKVVLNVVGFAVLFMLGLANAFLVMLGLGAAHEQWPQIPAIGYGGTLLMVLGISALAGSIHGGMRVKTSSE